jgi:hypothetical protein
LVRLKHDVSPFPSPSAQPSLPLEALVKSFPLSPSSANLFVISANTSASSEKNIKGNRTAIKEKSIVEGAKKRRKALKRVGILDNV